MATTSSELVGAASLEYTRQPASTPRRGRRPARILGWLGIALVCCVVLELACRVEDWVMYRMPLWSRYTSLDQLVVRDAAGMHGRPNAQYEKWSMNALGMRGPEAPVTSPPGTHRIIAAGASETFGLRESVGKEYPRQLEDSLNARVAKGECRLPASGRFEVLNAAFAGMGLPTIEQDVRTRLARLRPEFILIYPSPASYLDESPPKPASPDSQYRIAELPLSGAFYPRSIARLREQLKQVVPEFLASRLRAWQTRSHIAGHAPGWRFESIPAERLSQYDADLRKLIGTVRSVGAIPIVATHGNEFMDRASIDRNMLVAWEKFYPRATAATIVAMDSAARVVTQRVAGDSSAIVVDAAKTLAAAPLAAFADFVHFTNLGAGIMAGTLSDGVLAAARAAGVCSGGSSAGNATGGAD